MIAAFARAMASNCRDESFWSLLMLIGMATKSASRRSKADTDGWSLYAKMMNDFALERSPAKELDAHKTPSNNSKISFLGIRLPFLVAG